MVTPGRSGKGLRKVRKRGVRGRNEREQRHGGRLPPRAIGAGRCRPVNRSGAGPCPGARRVRTSRRCWDGCRRGGRGGPDRRSLGPRPRMGSARPCRGSSPTWSNAATLAGRLEHGSAACRLRLIASLVAAQEPVRTPVTKWAGRSSARRRAGRGGQGAWMRGREIDPAVGVQHGFASPVPSCPAAGCSRIRSAGTKPPGSCLAMSAALLGPRRHRPGPAPVPLRLTRPPRAAAQGRTRGRQAAVAAVSVPRPMPSARPASRQSACAPGYRPGHGRSAHCDTSPGGGVLNSRRTSRWQRSAAGHPLPPDPVSYPLAPRSPTVPGGSHRTRRVAPGAAGRSAPIPGIRRRRAPARGPAFRPWASCSAARAGRPCATRRTPAWAAGR